MGTIINIGKVEAAEILSWKWGNVGANNVSSLFHKNLTMFVKGPHEWEFFGTDFEFCTISLLVMLKY